MKWFQALKIRTRILTIFGLVAIITGGIGAVYDMNMKMQDDRDTVLYAKAALSLQYLGMASNTFQEIVLLNQKLRTEYSPAMLETADNMVSLKAAEIRKDLRLYASTTADSASDAGAMALSAALHTYVDETNVYFGIVRSAKYESAMHYHRTVLEKDNKAIAFRFLSLIDANASGAQQLRNENSDILDSIRALSFIMIGTFMVLALGFGIYLSFAVKRELELEAYANSVQPSTYQRAAARYTPEEPGQTLDEEEAASPMYKIVGVIKPGPDPALQAAAASARAKVAASKAAAAIVTAIPARAAVDGKLADAPAVQNQPVKKMRMFDDTIEYQEVESAKYR